MYQQSPLPIKHTELPVTPNVLSNETYRIPEICVDTVKSVTPTICDTPQSIEINYQTKSEYNIDPNFLIICIALLLVLLAVVGFVGYWVLTRHNHSNSKTNKRRERFLTIFLYGFGILTAIVIFFLFYLIICH